LAGAQTANSASTAGDATRTPRLSPDHKLRLACAWSPGYIFAMSPRLVPTLVVLALAALPVFAAEPEGAHKIKVVVTPPDPDLTYYYVGLLSAGPRANVGTPEERKGVQAAKREYFNRLAKEGKLLVSGPIDDKTDLWGIYIYKASSIGEAKTLAADDPEVKMGRLKIDVHPWLTEKGAIRDPEFTRAR